MPVTVVLAARMSSSGTALPVHVRGFGPLQVGFRVSCRYVFVVPNETTTAYEVGVHVAGITAPAVSVIVRQAAAVQPDEHGAVPEPSAEPLTVLVPEFHAYTAADTEPELTTDDTSGICTVVIVYATFVV